MAQRIVFMPEIGEVVLSKRRGNTHLRLSINAAGKVRVGMPYWMPYQAGIAFAKSKSAWIQKHLAAYLTLKLQSGDLIGKSHRIKYIYNPSDNRTTLFVTNSQIIVKSNLSINDQRVQDKMITAGERALKVESERLLPQRVQYLASKHGFSYKQIRVRKLTARWGSCSNNGVITLSYYLLQLPWNLIDYVILHELTHTRHLHHGPNFWIEFKKVLPSAKLLQKEIRSYKPQVQAFQISTTE